MVLSSLLASCGGMNYARSGRLKKVNASRSVSDENEKEERIRRSEIRTIDATIENVEEEHISENVNPEIKAEVITEGEKSEVRSFVDQVSRFDKSSAGIQSLVRKSIVRKSQNKQKKFSRSGVEFGDILYILLLVGLIILGLIFEPELTLILIIAGALIFLLAWLFFEWFFGLFGF